MSDRETLIEQVLSAFRERDALGRVQASPAWHDLSDDDRLLAHREALRLRRLEAALDPEGLSATARALVDRVSGRRRM